MKGFLLVLLGFVLGGIVTFVTTSGLLTGVGAGVGIATGLQAGACLTVEAAKDKGFISADQVEEVLQAAFQQMATTEVDMKSDPSPMGDAECQAVLAKLNAATSN